MYNPEVKSRFIDEFSKGKARKQAAKGLFDVTESKEVELGRDICACSADEVSSIMDTAVGSQCRSVSTRLSILKAYMKWCVANDIPGAHVVDIDTDNLGMSKFASHFVSGPSHLQMYLDAAFKSEAEETQDNVYRCIYWLAFGGMPEGDMEVILDTDVRFDIMRVIHRPGDYPIYREAVPAFRNCVVLKSFNRNQYDTGNWRSNGKLVKKRADGNKLLRTFNGVPSIDTARHYMNTANTMLHKRVANGEVDPSLDLSLSYKRAWLSGLFYRMYETERSHVSRENIFHKAADLYLQCYPDSTDASEESSRLRRNSMVRDLKNDYLRWKQIFT